MKLKIISLLVMLSILLLIFLVGCDGRIKKSEAEEMAQAFLTAIEKGDFAAAQAYLHPERPIDLEKYFNGVEAREGVDFQKGIEMKRYTDFSFSRYEKEVKGSECELEVDVVVDGVTLELSVDIVKNDLGYGIYEIDLER